MPYFTNFQLATGSHFTEYLRIQVLEVIEMDDELARTISAIPFAGPKLLGS